MLLPKTSKMQVKGALDINVMSSEGGWIVIFVCRGGEREF